MTSKVLEINDNKIVGDDDSKVNEMVKNLAIFKNLKNRNWKVLIYIKAIKNSIFLFLGLKKLLTT